MTPKPAAQAVSDIERAMLLRLHQVRLATGNARRALLVVLHSPLVWIRCALKLACVGAALMASVAATVASCNDGAPHQQVRSGVSTGDGVRLRAAPGESARVVLKVRKGEAVRVVDETDEWYRVTVRGRTGYMARRYVRSDAIIAVSGSSIDRRSLLTRLKRVGLKWVRRFLEAVASVFWTRTTAIVLGITAVWVFVRRRKTAEHVVPQVGGFLMAFAITVAAVLSTVAVLTVLLDIGLNMPLQYALPITGAITAVAVLVLWRNSQLRRSDPTAAPNTPSRAVAHAVLTEPKRA